MLFYVKNSEEEWNEIWNSEIFLLSHFIQFFFSFPSSLSRRRFSHSHVKDIKSTPLTSMSTEFAACSRHYNASNLIVYFIKRWADFIYSSSLELEIYEENERWGKFESNAAGELEWNFLFYFISSFCLAFFGSWWKIKREPQRSASGLLPELKSLNSEKFFIFLFSPSAQWNSYLQSISKRWRRKKKFSSFKKYNTEWKYLQCGYVRVWKSREFVSNEKNCWRKKLIKSLNSLFFCSTT